MIPHAASIQRFFRWRSQFDGIDVDDTHIPKELEFENAMLNWLLAE